MNDDQLNDFDIPLSEMARIPALEDGPIRVIVGGIENNDPLGWRWLLKTRSEPGHPVVEYRPFQEGDELTITQPMQVDLVRAALQFSGALGKELKMQQTLDYTRRFEVGRKIRFVAKRMDRFRVFLTMSFENDPEEGMWNLEIPRLAGFVFIEPDSPELSIMECPRGVPDGTGAGPQGDHGVLHLQRRPSSGRINCN